MPVMWNLAGPAVQLLSARLIATALLADGCQRCAHLCRRHSVHVWCVKFHWRSDYFCHRGRRLPKCRDWASKRRSVTLYDIWTAIGIGLYTQLYSPSIGSHNTLNRCTEKKRKQTNQSFTAFSQHSQKHRTTYNRQACLSEHFTQSASRLEIFLYTFVPMCRYLRSKLGKSKR